MNEPKNLQSKCNLLRVAVWGQGLGMLISGAFLMVEDAPEIFLRFSPWRVLLIVVCLIVISMRKPSTYLARGLPVWLLASLVLIVSLSSILLYLVSTLLAYDIPDMFITSRMQYTQITSLVSLLVFSAALALNLVFVNRTFRVRQ